MKMEVELELPQCRFEEMDVFWQLITTMSNSTFFHVDIVHNQFHAGLLLLLVFSTNIPHF